MNRINLYTFYTFTLFNIHFVLFNIHFPPNSSYYLYVLWVFRLLFVGGGKAFVCKHNVKIMFLYFYPGFTYVMHINRINCCILLFFYVLFLYTLYFFVLFSCMLVVFVFIIFMFYTFYVYVYNNFILLCLKKVINL